MSPDLHGLDKVAARTRKVTPPRRPAPVAGTADGASPDPATPPTDAGDTSPAPQARATSAPRRAATSTPAAGATKAQVIPRAAPSEQLGVRLHGYQMRRLRRVVRLLDEDEALHRPTQAEVIQVLVDALPDGEGAELAELAGRIRAYRLRIVD